MGSWRRFQPRPLSGETCRDRGTKGERPCGRPSKAVGPSGPRAECKAQGREPRAKSSGVDTLEKLQVELRGCPYRKPTQVGKASSLR